MRPRRLRILRERRTPEARIIGFSPGSQRGFEDGMDLKKLYRVS